MSGIRVMSGRPDDAELAALTVALAVVLRTRPAAPTRRGPAAWLRPQVHTAPTAWTAQGKCLGRS